MHISLTHKSSGFNYIWIERSLRLSYRLLFRKIYLHRAEGVPGNKPVIIAANHPTAFIEPILFCLFFDPPVYNMTRGDIFRKPLARKILESFNMFPVFRQRDGYSGRDRNDEVFEFCQRKLRKRVAVNIFVEGEHHLDKRLRTPLKKGLARIAFGTYENYPMDDLQIVPVGSNFLYGDRTRDEVKVIVGTPIFVKDYWPTYLENPSRAVNQLNRAIETALKSICYEIESEADDVLAAQLLELLQSEHPQNLLPIVERSGARFFREKSMLDRLNTLPAEPKETLREQCAAYFGALESAGLNDAALLNPQHASWGWAAFLILGFVPFVVGYLLSWPVRRLARTVAGKLVKKREFYTSVLLGVGHLSGMIWGLLLLTIGLAWQQPMILSLALLFPLLTWFSITYREIFQRWATARKALSSTARTELREMRARIRPILEA
jgi:1-acyl-sn-glycerol-3-phosphate acyltransferase